MSPRHGVAILGATGSIGASALAVLERHKARYRIEALSAHRNVEAMLELCRRHQPPLAVMNDAAAAAELGAALKAEGLAVEVMAGARGLDAAASEAAVDVVIAAIVGAAGLASTLAAARAGKRLLLANKEAVVCAGELLMSAVAQGGATLLPVDSEHNAIFQCLHGHAAADLESVMLPASGGPFHDWSKQRLEAVTPEQACAHPVWPGMGAKISVDSATLMNKGLELIEACHLFSLPSSSVRVLVHPQAVVHGAAQFADGSMIAHLSAPDMRLALASALAWPERLASGCDPVDLTTLSGLEFFEPDRDRFACLRLAETAAAAGGDAPLRLNAANEVAVEAFLCQDIGFNDIPKVVGVVMEAAVQAAPGTLEELEEMDGCARRHAREALRGLRG